jgi:hypothetical protein
MNDEFEQELRQQLRASEDTLDAPTLARLHAARNRALAAAGSGREGRWSSRSLTWLAATAAASTAVVALFLGRAQSPEEAPLPVAELENTLLAAAGNEEIPGPAGEEAVPGSTDTDTAETLDLLENLEFYEWLSEQEPEEQPS